MSKHENEAEEKARLDKITRRVEALLTQAEDPGVTPEEAQAFLAKAEELMLKYSITEAQGRRAGEKPGIEALRVPFEAPAYLFRHLGVWGVGAVVEAIGLCGFAYRKFHRGGGEFVLYGTKADTEHTAKVIRSLVRQARYGLTLWKAEDATYDQLRAVSQSWATQAAQNYVYGFARGAARRITETRLAVTEETHGAELVLVHRAAEIKEAMEDVGTSRSQSPKPSLGFRAGVRDGQSAVLGNEVSVNIGA